MTCTMFSKARKVARADWRSYVKDFVKNYREEDEIMSQNVGVEDLMAMASLLGKVHIVAKEFLKDTMSKNPLTREDLNIGIKDLTKNEVRRIYGALVKLELYCAVFADAVGDYDHPHGWFGYPAWANSEYPPNWLAHEMEEFLHRPRNWEVEELYCVQEFCFQFYDRVFRSCRKKDRILMFMENETDRPKAVLKTPGARNPRYLDYGTLSEIMMSCGVEVLAEFIAMGISEPSESEQRARLVYKRRGSRSPYYHHSFLSGNLYMHVDELHFASNRVEKETGSSSTADDDEWSPNAGWHWAFKDEFHHAHWTNRHHIRAWAYVMWDEFRLKDLGLMDQDASQWEYGPKAWRGRLLSDDLPSSRVEEDKDEEDEDEEDGLYRVLPLELQELGFWWILTWVKQCLYWLYNSLNPYQTTA